MRLRTRLIYGLTGIVPAPLLRPIFSYRCNRAYQSVLGESAEHSFTTIAQRNTWGGSESLSGNGSDIGSTARVRDALPRLMTELDIKSVLDAPCGDFLWIRHLPMDHIDYVGADIVAPLIAKNEKEFGTERRRFVHADITRSDLARCDLILCRDCFIHLSFRDIGAAITNFKRSGAKYLLTTHYPRIRLNWDIRTGAFRPINLCRWPFTLPEPQRTLAEDPPNVALANNPNFDRVLGLWELSKIEVSPALRG